MFNRPKVYTPEQVAEILQLSKNTVYELIKRGEIVAKKFGKVYRIPASSLSFVSGGLPRHTIQAPLHIEDIKRKAHPILKSAGVTRSALFGSIVRGEAGEDSDIDMLVDFPKGKSLFDFIGLQLKLEDALQKKVDLITYTGIKPRLRERILREQVQIL